MNTHRLTLAIAILALASATGSILLAVGCSSSSTPEPAPTSKDSGSDSAIADSASRKDTGVESDAHIRSDASDASEDAVSLDTGACVPESSTCNSCYTDAQAAADPYNTCSPYTASCVPFTLPVPTHPTL
jgi:hypothetical protein